MKSICVGTGLVALDIILNGSPSTPPKYQAGGSCGNVLTILSFLGWASHPIARLAKDSHSVKLINDLKKWRVNTNLLTRTRDGSTPIIIHRIIRNKLGQPIHRFEFKEPETGNWLPRYKPVLNSSIDKIKSKQPIPKLFYFDRINRGAIELAKYSREKGALVFFEPSSIGNIKLFKECLETSDIVKFSTDRIKNYSKIFPKQQTILEIQTCGKDGLLYRFNINKKSRKWKKLNPYKITNLIDSGGAGDWCSAGIIYKLGGKARKSFLQKDEKQIIESLQFGQILGAINCLFDGARGTMYNLNKEQVIRASKSFNNKSTNNIDNLITVK